MFYGFSLLVVTVNLSAAQGINWGKDPYSLRTRGMPIKKILRDIGASYHLPVIVSESVNDNFTGNIDNESPEDILNRLSRLYNLTWYFNGDTLYVYKAREIDSKVITSQYITSQELKRYLTENHVIDRSSCRLQEVKGFQTFEVLGVPACVERVTRLASEIDRKAQTEATNKETVGIFKLRYASAADVTYHYRQQDVVVPGVVSILNQMKSGNALPLGDGNASVGQQSGDTQFSADPGQNSVIVRTREINLALYEDLISKMDVQNHQIEIAVSIIDVDEGHLNQLGVDWAGNFNIGGAGVGFNSGIAGNSSFSSVISNSNEFMAQVSALQQRSQAQILSQPSVVTLNNVQAVLDKNVTFYTKLEGKDVAKLESVTSGTLMRVTPRIVENAQVPGAIDNIMLVLNIQDGQQQGVTSASEPLPQVQNSEITTQATLKPGQSLLLGGFIQDKKINAERGIPILSDIPLIGSLFGARRDETHSVVRLFLIKASPIRLEQ
jgi:type III secretion protein C